MGPPYSILYSVHGEPLQNMRVFTAWVLGIPDHVKGFFWQLIYINCMSDGPLETKLLVCFFAPRNNFLFTEITPKTYDIFCL